MKKAWLLKCISALLGTFFIMCCCLSVRAETRSEALNKRPVGIYDAEFDENGDPTYYGTWKCANCGSVLPATLGNVMYYYQLDESAQAPETPEDSSGTDLTLAGGENYDDSSPADTEPAAREIPIQEQTETEQELPREQTEEATEAEQTEETDDGRTGLWIAVSAGALVFIVIETVFLVRSLKKSKTTI